MDLQARIDLMKRLREYLTNSPESFETVKEQAFMQNPWFVPTFIESAIQSICNNLLDPEKLNRWMNHYHIDDHIQPKTVGIIMAGNIPLVGFHDFLAAFICGHYQKVKLSSKDDVLFPFIFKKLSEWNPDFNRYVSVEDLLKNCDAYIATGSNNTSRYFEFYFASVPHIIRKGKTSVAVLSGNESPETLSQLSDDIHLYFGRGCRNITKLYVPDGYNFERLLHVFKKYEWFSTHHRYKNNFDYQLALLLMNNRFYMTNNTVLLVENNESFPPIGMVYYQYYTPPNVPEISTEQIQCMVGRNDLSFGAAQHPGLFDYADNIDTMQFLLGI